MQERSTTSSAAMDPDVGLKVFAIGLVVSRTAWWIARTRDRLTSRERRSTYCAGAIDGPACRGPWRAVGDTPRMLAARAGGPCL